MKIACLQFNPIQENTYVVWDDTSEAVVIDAGNSNPREDAALDNFIAQHGLKPVLAVNTHGHFDHTLGVEHLKQRYGIPFALSSKDRFLLDNAATSGSVFGVKIGAADGPTSILVSQVLHSNYIGPIAVAAYSYMALVPIIQPFAIKLVTTKKERAMHMPYNPKHVSRALRICFPIMVTIIAGFIAPMSVSLVGFLMFGNLLRECGCLERLSQTAQNDLANLITLLLGITISFSMQADQFVNLKTLIIMALGLVAFVFDSIAGVMFAKLLNLFCKNKVNPMVGAAGISAFPMSARVIQKMGQEADCTNHLLMHAVGANVAGQIASVLAGGMILNLVPQLMG